MTLEQKLYEELMRFKSINNYAKKMIVEQDVPAPPPPGGDVAAAPPPPGDLPAGAPPPDAATPPIDAATPPAMPEESEEIDITDLVNMTKSIKKEVEDSKDEHGNVMSKMDDVFTKLNDLESKLAQMDNIFSKINELGSKVEKMKEPTAVEKLEMRSLDSYPFSQNPKQFFDQKQPEMKASGKNDYILTKDEIQNYSLDTIRKTFNPENPDEFKF